MGLLSEFVLLYDGDRRPTRTILESKHRVRRGNDVSTVVSYTNLGL